MADDTFGADGHLFEADGYTISLGENVWRRCQENPTFAAALRVVVRDTEGGDKGGDRVFSLALAKLANMTTNELGRVSTLDDVLRRPPSSV